MCLQPIIRTHFLLLGGKNNTTMKKILKNNKNAAVFQPSFLTLCLCLLFQIQAFGQGFYQEYHPLFNGTRAPERILLLPGGNFGLPIDDSGGGPIAWLETDANGNTVSLIQNNTPLFSQNLVVTNDRNYVLMDTTFNPSAPSQHFLRLQWRTFGNVVLQTQLYTIDPLRGYSGIGKIISDDNGNFYVVGLFTNANNDMLLYGIQFDAAGNIVWQAPLNTAVPSGFTKISHLELTLDGSLLIEYSGGSTGSQQYVLRKNISTGQEWSLPGLSPMGGDASGGTLYTSGNGVNFANAAQSILWHVDFNTLFNESGSVYPYRYVPVSGGWIIVASINFAGVQIAKIDASGNLIWKRTYPFFSFFLNNCTAGRELSDGSLILGGNYGENPFLLKLNPDGSVYPHNITGTVVKDINQDCLIDAGDNPLSGRVVTAQRQSDGLTLYGTTDANGHYDISDVDTGTYVVQVQPINYLWQVCGTPVTVTFSDPVLPATTTVDFELQLLYECPLFWTTVAAGQIRVCRQSTFNLYYCNSGTQTATDAYVELTLPVEFTIDSASASYTLQSPNVLHFEVGDIPADSCGAIQVYATLSCDPGLAGQTLCATSIGYPDTTCFPTPGLWSGANIEVSGRCATDSVRFDIINTGTGTTIEPLDFVIVEDHVISLQGQFELAGGASQTIALPKDGSTWRIQAAQEPNHPLGTEPASVAVEGCVENGATFVTGMVNLFPNTPGTLLEFMDCLVVNAYDPNEKLAFPIGVDAEHFIDQNISLNYQINFQNTGNAPANTVLLKDTLSPWLNPSSLRMGAASHPYSWSLSGAGILQVHFDGINLPDSTTNEAASHGFVQFRIAQQPNNPIGTVINNQAGIYFDSNPVVLTNVVTHTIGKDFLEFVAVSEPSQAPIAVSVQPNPTEDAAWIKMGVETDEKHVFLLFDALGRNVRNLTFTGESLYFKREGLPAGAYGFTILNSSGAKTVSGKVILK